MRETPRAMNRRVVACCGLAALAVVLLPALVAAQAPTDLPSQGTRGGGGSNLRDRYSGSKPQTTARLDDAVHKFNSDEPESRIEAVRLFGELQTDAKAMEYLLQAASDADMRVRIKAIDTVGNVKAKDATPILVQQMFLRDTEAPVKQHILAALGKIADPRAVQPLLDVVGQGAAAPLRGGAIYALGDIGDRAALPKLEALVKDTDDESVRRLAAEAVRKIKEKPAPPVVPPALVIDRRAPGQGGPPAP
jgi:HEAT repeat protein